MIRGRQREGQKMRPLFKKIQSVDNTQEGGGSPNGSPSGSPMTLSGLDGSHGPELERFQASAFEPADKVMGASEPNAMVVEHYRKLYVKLLYIEKETELKTLAFTSALAGEGKTLTSINLGLVMARDIGRPMLLVDCDMRRPQVSSMLGLPAKGPGLSAVLSGEASIDQAIFRLQGENLYVMPAGETPPNPTELLIKKMDRFVKQMKELFAFIIIDTPPVLPMPDQHLLSDMVDGFILVVMAGKTPREALSTALDSLSECNILGLILNGLEHTRSSHYYYASAKYYKRR